MDLKQQILAAWENRELLKDAAYADAFEIFWSATTNNIKVESITGLTGHKATVPANIVTVTQVG